jgi:hypothetical protein
MCPPVCDMRAQASAISRKVMVAMNLAERGNMTVMGVEATGATGP